MLAAGEDVRAQILKVGHHGSSSASSPDFLAAVRPEVAIYSCGVGNSYDHPHAETLAALGRGRSQGLRDGRERDCRCHIGWHHV